MEYLGLNWEDKIYKSMSSWHTHDSKKLGFDFPNLPYLIDGELKLTETTAILMYLPMKANK
jgi:glutathione S-transferase